jgi:hypothetical protein
MRAPRVHAIERRLEASVVEQLVQDYEAGVPTTQLTKKYDIGKGTVLKLLRDHDVRVRRQGLSPAEIAEAIDLYTAGWSLRRLTRSSVMRTPSSGKHCW